MSSNSIDLHTHTTHSDGSDAPRDLVALAARAGARAIAITDHDTVTGLQEGRTAAQQLGVEFVNGIEISAEYSPGTMHLLGYCIDPSTIEPELLELKMARDNRNPQIATRLQELGLDIEYDEVAALAGGEMVGRPHFARLMVDRGYVESIQDAFNRFLAKGAPAYVEKKRLSPRQCIDLIHRAGGVAVLAHPYQLKLTSFEAVDGLVGDLAASGLDGIEAVYSRHSTQERDTYTNIARGHRLLISGGSDYHGSYKPDLSVVTGKGDLEVPYGLLEEIKERAAAKNHSR
jgi:predicted metal-dependent phosphoesterase TrpH